MAYRLAVVKEYQDRESGRVNPEHLVIRYGFLGFGTLRVPEEVREAVTAVGLKWSKSAHSYGNEAELPDEIGARLKKLLTNYVLAVRELNRVDSLGPFTPEKDELLKDADFKVTDARERLERF